MAGIPRSNIDSTAPQGQSEGRSGYGWGLRTSRSTSGGWEPTVSYLLILIVVEFAAYCALRYAFRSTLGG